MAVEDFFFFKSVRVEKIGIRLLLLRPGLKEFHRRLFDGHESTIGLIFNRPNSNTAYFPE